MFGVIISGIQGSALEHKGMKTANWSGENSTCANTMSLLIQIPPPVGLLVAYTSGLATHTLFLLVSSSLICSDVHIVYGGALVVPLSVVYLL